MNLDLGIDYLTMKTAIGDDLDTIYQHFLSGKTSFVYDALTDVFTSKIHQSDEELLNQINPFSKTLKFADRSVLLALLAIHPALKTDLNSKKVMVSFGSSRGAAQTLEKNLKDFTEGRKLMSLSSPLTTLGNIASFVSQYIHSSDATIEHSMTCSTGLQAILNGAAWIKAGFSDLALVGAAEAPLTPFNIEQMKVLKVYSKALIHDPYPNKSLDFNKVENSLILGEGAVSMIVEPRTAKHAYYINAGGYYTEPQKSPIAIQAQGTAYAQAMSTALRSAALETVDVIVTHSTGTVIGDLSEYNAIKSTFKTLPKLTSTKWIMGHTFGMSGLSNIILAILMLEKQQFIGIPYLDHPHVMDLPIKNVMVNTLGFGGMAVSLIISKNEL